MEDHSQCPPEPWRAELRLGLEELRAGEFQRAEFHFARAHRFAPDRPEVCCALGRERLRAGRTGEAERLLRAAWERDPSLVSAAAALARCLGLHLSRFAEAHEVLDDAGALHPGAASLWVVRAELLLEEGRVEPARQAAEDALARCGDEEGDIAREAARATLARVINQEAVALVESGEVEASVFLFHRAADLDPEWSGPVVNLGAAFYHIGRRERARAAYRLAIEIDPDNAAAHHNLGVLCFDLDELDASVAHLRDAAELTPADAEIWVALARVLAVRDDNEAAEGCLRQALELDPDHRAAGLALAELLARDGRLIEAAHLAARARGLDSPPPALAAREHSQSAEGGSLGPPGPARTRPGRGS